jgi:phosphoribosylanthranilate isomerase
MTKVKICGITNLEDALLSVQFGADELGFNFYPKSPRYVRPEQIRLILEQLPANILTIGVFVDANHNVIEDIMLRTGLTAVQLHGSENAEFVRRQRENIDATVIKAFRVSNTFKAEDVLQFDVDAILLDAYSPNLHGGTGETFDWEIAKQVRGIYPKMYLAGGLSPENVRQAISDVAPFAVDVCSAVESSPGKKDSELLRRFIAEAKRND